MIVYPLFGFALVWFGSFSPKPLALFLYVLAFVCFVYGLVASLSP